MTGLKLLIYAIFFVLFSGFAYAACNEGDEIKCGYDDVGECSSGVQICKKGEWSICLGTKGPTDEVCDDLKDNDCDGSIDENCECKNGETKNCGPLNDDGICEYGKEKCAGGEWDGNCTGAVYPFPVELCGANKLGNNLDDDCNGIMDDGCGANVTSSLNQTNATGKDHCYNNAKDFDEDSTDCGGKDCVSCPSCSDRIKNQNETGLDCGGPCPLCSEKEKLSCSNMKQDEDEDGVDCGGECRACNDDEKDSDRDGLKDISEKVKGTNLFVKDSDGDGMDDSYDKMPLCPNLNCDEIYGENKNNCSQDCKSNKSWIFSVLLVVFLFAGLFLYIKLKKAAGNTRVKNESKESNSRLASAEREVRYESVLKGSGRRKEIKSEIDKKLEELDKAFKR